MLFDLYFFFRELVLPPSGLLILLILGSTALALRRPRLGVTLVAGATGLFLLLSLPTVGVALWYPLQAGYPPLTEPPSAGDCGAIVVLGGGLAIDAPEYGGDTVSGTTLVRLRYAARLARASGLPLLVTGGRPLRTERSEGEAMAEALRADFGLTARWIETGGNTTKLSARLARPMLDADGIETICLVSHAYHLGRAVPAFVEEGFKVLAAPTGIARPPTLGWRGFIPRANGFSRSARACREWLGRAAYWVWNRLT